MPSFVEAWGPVVGWVANMVHAVLISCSWSAVRPFSEASLERRGLGAAGCLPFAAVDGVGWGFLRGG